MNKILMLIGKHALGALIISISIILAYKLNIKSMYFPIGYICGIIIIRLYDFLDKAIKL